MALSQNFRAFSGSFNHAAIKKLNSSTTISELYKENKLSALSLGKLAGARMQDELDEERLNNLMSIQWADMKL